jgi:uncharacterized membrane protein
MDLNRLVSYLLRVGVFASALLCMVGLLMWAVGGFNNVVIVAGSAVVVALASAFRGSYSGTIYLAIVVLVATPVFRVAISVVYFLKEGDRKYVLISVAVLSMLLFALFSGYSG